MIPLSEKQAAAFCQCFEGERQIHQGKTLFQPAAGFKYFERESSLIAPHVITVTFPRLLTHEYACE